MSWKKDLLEFVRTGRISDELKDAMRHDKNAAIAVHQAGTSALQALLELGKPLTDDEFAEAEQQLLAAALKAVGEDVRGHAYMVTELRVFQDRRKHRRTDN